MLAAAGGVIRGVRSHADEGVDKSSVAFRDELSVYPLHVWRAKEKLNRKFCDPHYSGPSTRS